MRRRRLLFAASGGTHNVLLASVPAGDKGGGATTAVTRSPRRASGVPITAQAATWDYRGRVLPRADANLHAPR